MSAQRQRRRPPRWAIAGPLLVGLVLAPGARARVIDAASSFPMAGTVYGSVRAPHCSLKDAQTMTVNHDVRIFHAPYRDDGILAFGCLRRADRAYVLAQAGDCQNNNVIDTAVVAGTVAALNLHTCGEATSESRIALVTLRNGHVVFASTPMDLPFDATSFDAIRGMVVTAAGRLAWIGVRKGPRGNTFQVRRRAHGPDRHAVLLDSGGDIDPRSLRKDGARVSWVKAGSRRSAEL